MITRGPRYSGEVFEQRGDEIYARDILPNLKPDDDGKYVAIDIETGLYVIDEKSLAATDRRYEMRPEAQPWVVCVGRDYVDRIPRDFYSER